MAVCRVGRWMRGKQEGRGSGIEGCRAVWLGELKVKREKQERVQETTAEQVVTAAEVVASTVVESVDGCEDRPQEVEAPVFVSRDRIQRLALRQLAGCLEAVEESVTKVVLQDSTQQRTFEQFADFPEVGMESFFLVPLPAKVSAASEVCLHGEASDECAQDCVARRSLVMV